MGNYRGISPDKELQKMSKKIIVVSVVAAVAFLVFTKAIQHRLDSLYPRIDHWWLKDVLGQVLILLIHDPLTQGRVFLGIVLLAGVGYRYRHEIRRELDDFVGL